MKIIVACVMAGLFTVFNVGLPFAVYVCPMMRDGGSACDCKTVQEKQLAIGYERGDCCNTHFVAERNTIPFLGTNKYQTPNSEIVSFVPSTTLYQCNDLQVSRSLYSFDSGPPAVNTPLYLLSSSLLI